MAIQEKSALVDLEDQDFFSMANLFPKHTGLPFVVWISVRSGARHDVRVKVSPGPRAQPTEMISVGIRPTVHVIEGPMETSDLELLTRWVELNREMIVSYWDGIIDTVDALSRLRSV